MRQLAYRSFGAAGGDGPSEAQMSAVDREVRRLLDEGLVVERSMFGTERYLMPAAPAAVGPAPTTLQCLDCDLLWVSEEGAPHPDCWSCGKPGLVVVLRPRRPARQRSGASR